MKHILRMSVIACMGATIMLGSAAAARADETVVAKVPFAFIVGDLQLPSGVYVIREMTDSSGVVAIKNKDGDEFVYALTIPSSADTTVAQSELVFEKFGSHYFLARIAPQGGNERQIVLTPSRMEQEIVAMSSRSTN